MPPPRSTSEAGSASISIEHAPDVFLACPIAAPPPFQEPEQVGPPASDSANTAVAPATARRLDEETSAPSLSSLKTLDRQKGGVRSRFPEVQPQPQQLSQEQRCRIGRGVNTAFLSQAQLAAGATHGQVMGGQQVSEKLGFIVGQDRNPQMTFLSLDTERGWGVVLVCLDNKK